ncbi:MAG: hypothetical protein ACR2PT_21515 [Endozoicomonas sp.]
MRNIVERYISSQRQLVITAVENWWDKYKVTLTEIEHQRDQAATKLQYYLENLGYVQTMQCSGKPARVDRHPTVNKENRHWESI